MEVEAGISVEVDGILAVGSEAAADTTASALMDTGIMVSARDTTRRGIIMRRATAVGSY